MHMAKGDRLYSKALAEARNERHNVKLVQNLLEKAMKLGNPKAIYALGTWYLHGKNVVKDTSKAIEFFKLASEGDVSDAYFDLAVCFEKGVGVKLNEEKAFANYLKAALIGDKQAIYEVGRCYYHGIGVTKNKKIANIWLEWAEKNGITE